MTLQEARGLCKGDEVYMSISFDDSGRPLRWIVEAAAVEFDVLGRLCVPIRLIPGQTETYPYASDYIFERCLDFYHLTEKGALEG